MSSDAVYFSYFIAFFNAYLSDTKINGGYWHGKSRTSLKFKHFISVKNMGPSLLNLYQTGTTVKSNQFRPWKTFFLQLDISMDF